MISFSRFTEQESGAFGNQMFQYAFLRSMARRLRVKFYCHAWAGDREFELNDGLERAPAMEELPHRYVEPQPTSGFQPEALSIRDGTDVMGFFQSERYFGDPEEVRSWFTFNLHIRSVRRDFDHIDFDRAVSMSLRLNNDYVKRRGKYPLYPLRYYREALARVERPAHILVFSDRPARARQCLSKLIDDRFEFIEQPDVYEQLYLMGCCRDNIITNSTFSWWGAWLNPRSDKLVIIPRPWFRNGCGVTNPDIAAEGWIELPAADSIWQHAAVWRATRPLRRLFVRRAYLR